ncbi:senecionine N-oxygenase-like [Euwallacea fornicatus]|uniref:senecionine N-oxygenase-like n=1 Tax=Euwallacea fornicatus TaxID=995702 RepID=UPI00338EFC1E
MRVAVIGAGPAGLAAARQVSSFGFELDVFEMKPELGGTWVYTDEVGTDRYGYPVYSAMYKGLRTNLPKEIMGYPDFPIAEEKRSYLTQAEVLEFINLYAEKFHLKDHIKFNTMVMDVRPADSKWKLTYEDKPTGKSFTEYYDSVMICNGHYNDPLIPTIPGQENFTGVIDHSRNYRDPEKFRGQRVLIMGAGSSGLDLTLQTSSVAAHVALSHRKSELNIKFPPNVELRPNVQRIVNFNTVEFVDGSCSCFDAIIFCTGYKYSFPFLHESCGITIDDNLVQPLYKHMIHIERPTMCILGIPYDVCRFQLYDLQARYYCKYLEGSMSLPSAEEMRRDTQQDLEKRRADGYTNPQLHMMGPYQESYYNGLAQEADTTSIPPVLIKIRDISVQRRSNDLMNFREDQYRILDDNNFVVSN